MKDRPLFRKRKPTFDYIEEAIILTILAAIFISWMWGDRP